MYTYTYLPYSTPLWNRFGGVWRFLQAQEVNIFISQNLLKG